MLHFNKSLAFVFLLVLFVTKAMAFTSNLNFFVVIVFLFSSPSNTVLDLSSQLAFSGKRFIIVSVYPTSTSPFHTFPPQVFTTYIPEC